MSKHDVFGQIKMSPSMFYYVIVTAKLIYWIFNQVLRSTFTRHRMNFRPVVRKIYTFRSSIHTELGTLNVRKF